MWSSARATKSTGTMFSEPPRIPTLYLHGAEDGCMTAQFTPFVRDALSLGSDAQVVGGAGHFLQLDTPDDVGRRIVEFLA